MLGTMVGHVLSHMLDHMLGHFMAFNEKFGRLELGLALVKYLAWSWLNTWLEITFSRSWNEFTFILVLFEK